MKPIVSSHSPTVRPSTAEFATREGFKREDTAERLAQSLSGMGKILRKKKKKKKRVRGPSVSSSTEAQISRIRRLQRERRAGGLGANGADAHMVLMNAHILFRAEEVSRLI